ncbi:MAG: 3-dehydroquinate synthase, partial [Tannerella sp.]|nr:3-dehydroquinate synthase [Tannerella sp.]
MVTITRDIAYDFASYLSSCKYDKIFVLTDTNTREKCLPVLEPALTGRNAEYITIEAGDVNKNLNQV